MSPSQFLWWFEISGDSVFVATALLKAQIFCFLITDTSCLNMDLVPPLSSVQPVRTTLWHPILCTRHLRGHFLEAPSPDLPLPLTNLIGAAIGSVQPWVPLQSPWLWPCYWPTWLVSPFSHVSLFFLIKVLFCLGGGGSLSTLGPTNLNLDLVL